MKLTWTLTLGLLLAASSNLALADEQTQSDTSGKVNETIVGQPDAQTGLATRHYLQEQAQGIHRADTEPYRAEFAGKAYKAYADSIGQSSNGKSAQSQVSGISSN
ncbi:hypothetical protein [Limnobacter litoralis]|uniref:DUF4148 domain-containing protein n=1 Tax=Limnobacter litoralis TaxID=481366 RepID=A0ABQ5YU00_9BURK|nr:hypothetical protein [Limnobacter litoralis]GLR26880.1 hypothetical protein GCM10007875_19700 [Limnobacter litoralis]